MIKTRGFSNYSLSKISKIFVKKHRSAYDMIVGSKDSTNLETIPPMSKGITTLHFEPLKIWQN